MMDYEGGRVEEVATESFLELFLFMFLLLLLL